RRGRHAASLDWSLRGRALAAGDDPDPRRRTPACEPRRFRRSRHGGLRQQRRHHPLLLARRSAARPHQHHAWSHRRPCRAGARVRRGAGTGLGGAAGHVSVWDLSKARTIDGMDLLKGPVTGLAFSRDGEYLAISGAEENGYLFELSHGDRVPLQGHTDLVDAIAFAPDGSAVATGSQDGTVRLFAVPGGAPRRLISAAGMGPVLVVAFSADGKLIAAAGEDRTIRIWETKNFRLQHKIEGSSDAVLALAFS